MKQCNLSRLKNAKEISFLFPSRVQQEPIEKQDSVFNFLIREKTGNDEEKRYEMYATTPLLSQSSFTNKLMRMSLQLKCFTFLHLLEKHYGVHDDELDPAHHLQIQVILLQENHLIFCFCFC